MIVTPEWPEGGKSSGTGVGGLISREASMCGCPDDSYGVPWGYGGEGGKGSMGDRTSAVIADGDFRVTHREARGVGH